MWFWGLVLLLVAAALVLGSVALARSSGATGPRGLRGPQGDPGQAGSSTNTGSTGDQGPTGPTGAAGFDGDTGAQGPQGNTGAQGNTGPAGAGATGATGPAGGGSAWPDPFIVPITGTVQYTIASPSSLGPPITYIFETPAGSANLTIELPATIAVNQVLRFRFNGTFGTVTISRTLSASAFTVGVFASTTVSEFSVNYVPLSGISSGFIRMNNPAHALGSWIDLEVIGTSSGLPVFQPNGNSNFTYDNGD
jgi:hypothetical protein